MIIRASKVNKYVSNNDVQILNYKRRIIGLLYCELTVADEFELRVARQVIERTVSVEK